MNMYIPPLVIVFQMEELVNSMLCLYMGER